MNPNDAFFLVSLGLALGLTTIAVGYALFRK